MGVYEGMRTHVAFAKNYSTRISRHLLNAEWLGDRLGRQAQEEDEWLFNVYFGFDPTEAPMGGRKPDLVECCLVVSNPLGLSVAFLASCSGRATSKATAADLCVPETGAIWRRNTSQAKEAARKLRTLHGDYWNEMETLGAMACD